MCYSAEVKAEHRLYTRDGGKLDIAAFYELYWVPANPGKKGKFTRKPTPKALDAMVRGMPGKDWQDIAARIAELDAELIADTERELFNQKQRLTEAERDLSYRETKGALESKRIATKKIAWAQRKLADIKRTELQAKDSRIFPGWYAPVMVAENGERIVKPMRYQCRPAGKPAFYDRKYPGTYNARRDNLEGFWKGQFGHTHGLMIVSAFYENVSRHKVEGRELESGEAEENVVLEFRPQTGELMLVACLFSRWQGEGESLLSFAAITDEPPPEVAAAGHDRCIIPIKPENVDAWLNPNPRDLSALYRILDDRPRPYYEHRMAA